MIFVNTKAVFEWDGEKYIETHTEGYEYEGPIALADTAGDEDDPKYSNYSTSFGNTSGNWNHPMRYGGPSSQDTYGTSAVTKWINKGEGDLFTKITEGMKEATTREAYQPFFEVKQQSQQASFLNSMQGLGKTKSGAAIGFAGSTADSTMMSGLEDAYAQNIMDVEEQIGGKMADAKRTIADITQSNQGTALQLKGLEQGEEDEDDGTSFICGQIKKNGKLKFKESLGMMKFLLKAFITHPGATEWYTRNGMKIIKEANELGLDWSNPRLKRMFVTDILELEKFGHHNRAVWTYIENCLILSKELWIELDYNDSIWTNSMYNRIKGWVKMLSRKPTWEYGPQYLKTIMRFSNGI